MKLIFNRYLKIEERLYSQILLALISIFSQNMDEFEKQIRTLESVHLRISKYSAAPRIFNLLVCI